MIPRLVPSLRCTKRALGGVSLPISCLAGTGSVAWLQQRRHTAAAAALASVAATSSVQDTVHQKIKGRRRFYKTVGVRRTDDGQWRVLLDGRVLRTPARRPLDLPTECLARAVAAEWDAQTLPTGIEPAVMPLMTLCSTAIDQVAQDREPTVANVMRYFPTDTICFFASDDDRIILKRQRKLWRPLHSWAAKVLGAELATSQEAITRPQHPPQLVERARELVEAMDPFTLAALQCITMECKSLTVALAVVHRHITIEQAFDAARLEESFNIEQWGLVEGGHDLDISSARLQLSAASTLLWLCRGTDAQHKLHQYKPT